MTSESTLSSLDLMIDAVALEYEKATPEERQALSPFCKFFFELAQDNELVASGDAV